MAQCYVKTRATLAQSTAAIKYVYKGKLQLVHNDSL